MIAPEKLAEWKRLGSELAIFPLDGDLRAHPDDIVRALKPLREAVPELIAAYKAQAKRIAELEAEAKRLQSDIDYWLKERLP